MIIPVILSGGIGSRLWPLSRKMHPKPFIKFKDGLSLLQKTYQRAVATSSADEIIIVTNRDFFFYTKDEVEEMNSNVKKNTFLLEPVGRNTAAAIAIAAQYALDQYHPNCHLLVMPADNWIDNEERFGHAVRQAEDLVSQGKLVTFGIVPTSPETGYGYIQADGNIVQSFVEKPDRKTAEKYLSSGNYYWNSGIFYMSADSFLEELLTFVPDIAKQTSECIANAKQSLGEEWQQYEIQYNDFAQIRDISVDYAVFEKSQKVAVVPCDMGWSDIGSWKEFGALFPADKHQNNISGNVICEKTHNCVVYGGDRLIATYGIKDLIVADTVDALLVAHKDYAQEVRNIVNTLINNDDTRYKEFPTMHRPWGTYTVLQENPGYKLKYIEVKPGTRLSLQSHKHRSEHWVVVSGQAVVTNNNEFIELKANQSTYIPIGNIHRLENPGSEKLILIEVQCGEYLGEDDIVRYEDDYSRTQ